MVVEPADVQSDHPDLERSDGGGGGGDDIGMQAPISMRCTWTLRRTCYTPCAGRGSAGGCGRKGSPESARVQTTSKAAVAAMIAAAQKTKGLTSPTGVSGGSGKNDGWIGGASSRICSRPISTPFGPVPGCGGHTVFGEREREKGGLLNSRMAPMAVQGTVLLRLRRDAAFLGGRARQYTPGYLDRFTGAHRCFDNPD